VTVTVLTADTHGKAAGLRSALGVEVRIISGTDEAAEKRAVVEELGRERVFAVGNGANDALMLKTAAIGVCVIGPEGASASTFEHADVVVTSIADALGLLLHPARLVATLRT
jgi:P-type E1-E2 ATPase